MIPISRRRTARTIARCSSSGSVPTSAAEPIPRASSDRLRGHEPQLLGQERDAERHEPVDEVQGRQVAPHEDEHEALRGLHRDERLSDAQRHPERAARRLPPPAPAAVEARREVDRDERRAEDDVEGGHRTISAPRSPSSSWLATEQNSR